MNRSHFLKILGTGAWSLRLSGFVTISQNLRGNLKKVKIYDNFVRDVNFRKKYFLSHIPNLNAIELKHEAVYQYDRFSIKVLKNRKLLSYIAYDNIILTKWINQYIQLERIFRKSASRYAEDIHREL